MEYFLKNEKYQTDRDIEQQSFIVTNIKQARCPKLVRDFLKNEQDHLSDLIDKKIKLEIEGIDYDE